MSATSGERDPSEEQAQQLDTKFWLEINQEFIALYLHPLTVVDADIFDWLKKLEELISIAEDAGLIIMDAWPPTKEDEWRK